MSNLSKFWEKSMMSKKKFVVRKTLPPYVLPDVIDEESGQNIFSSILLFLVQTLGDHFEKGYIDLDDEWQNADYEKLLKKAKKAGFSEEILEEMELDAKWIKEIRETFLEQYPKPFCGRYAYLFNMETEMKEEKDGTGEVIGKKKGIRGFKIIKSKYNDTIRFYIYGRVAIFKNEELGYDKKWDHADGTTTNEKGEIVDNSDGIQYSYCGIFASQDCAEKITEYVKYKIENETEEEPFENWDAFLIGSKIGVKRKTDKDPANTPEISLTFNADDVVFID